MDQNVNASDVQGNAVQICKLTPEGECGISESKYDCCAFVIYCAAHHKVALSKPDNSLAGWLPFTPLITGKSWTEGALAGALIVLSGGETHQFVKLKSNPPFGQTQCMQVLRLQLPHTLRFVTRLIYYVQLNTSNEAFSCCQNTNRIKWFSLRDIQASCIENLWGPEVVEFCRLISRPIEQQVCEYSLDEAFLYLPRDPPRNMEEEMLKSNHITEKDVERLYADFIDHCFPSFYQTLDSFKCYMEKYGFEQNDNQLISLFRAFNYKYNGFLSFPELLMGLANIEPHTIHGELRVRFIFRYYANDAGTLGVDELRKMLIDIYPNSNPEMIDQKLHESMSIIGTAVVNNQERIALSDLIGAVGNHQFRGTSTLCRSSKPIFTQISQLFAAQTLKKLTAKQNISSVIHEFKGTCVTCKEKEYSLATHSVKINSDGTICEVSQIIDNHNVDNENLTPHKYSIEFVFNNLSAANVMMKMIKKFNAKKGTNKEPAGLMMNQPSQLWQMILALYNDIDVLLNEEDKCVRTFSPCYIIGDIHGNLEDLLSLEKSLWKRHPCVGANFLFLGDYVDRGQWGLECALYLISFKILLPNKVTLLRGNHEVRQLQAYYTYKRECVQKYGEEYGIKIWEITNKIFDKLPVSAIVDDAVYCAHGGIPRSAQTIAQINQIKKNLPDPERESQIAWEILWSDPCHSQQFIEICNFARVDPSETGGFIRNAKRGTAFQFNEMGANSFLNRNGLTHIIRAHEVPQYGYTFHFGNKCATIFSCSHYCGNNNDCACILADNQVLRVVRLDTVNNAPATD